MCRDNVEYRLPKVVQDFRAHIQKGNFDFKDDRVSSALDFLYVAYTENKGRDPEPIDRGFQHMGTYLEKLPLDENNAIFAIVCNLCDLYEERAFGDAFSWVPT